jgi:hypothetical protein
MADFARANWLAELLPNRLEVTNHGCPIHGFLVENSTNTETPVSWMADTYYSVGEYHDNGTHHYIVSAVELDQLSGTTEPPWPTDGTDVVDNHVTWTDLGPIGTAEGVYDAPGGTKEHDKFTSGLTSDIQSHNSCQLLQVPGMPAVDRTEAEQAIDAANKYHWQNYALLVNNWLHGRQLVWPGDMQNTEKHGLIYIDGNNVPWCIEVLSYVVSAWSVYVRMKCLFGRSGTTRGEPVITGRYMAHKSTDGSDITLTGGGTFMTGNDTGFTMSRNSTGSEAFVHLYEKGAGDVPYYQDDENNVLELRGVVKLSISGNGLISDDINTIGLGITCVATLHKGRDDIYSSASELTGERKTIDLFGETTTNRETIHPATPDCENVTPFSGDELTIEAVMPTPTYYDEYTVSITKLWRCTFDSDDNPVEIAYRTRTRAYEDYTVTGGGTRTWTIDYTGEWGRATNEVGQPYGPCFPLPGWSTAPAELSDNGPITINVAVFFGDEVSYQLLHNSTVVDQIVISDEGRREGVYTSPATGAIDATYTGSSAHPNEFPLVYRQIVDGVVNQVPHAIRLHVYSLDVLGMVVTTTEEGPGSIPERTLSAVATPGGADATHKGVKFTGDYPKLTSAYDPKNQVTVWNVEGLTDLGDGNTFTFV